MLADCRKLADDILKEKHGARYYIGGFKKLFRRQYDYPLDPKKLGGGRLSSMLESIPGVTIRGWYMFSSNKLPEARGDSFVGLADAEWQEFEEDCFSELSEFPCDCFAC